MDMWFTVHGLLFLSSEPFEGLTDRFYRKSYVYKIMLVLVRCQLDYQLCFNVLIKFLENDITH